MTGATDIEGEPAEREQTAAAGRDVEREDVADREMMVARECVNAGPSIEHILTEAMRIEQEAAEREVECEKVAAAEREKASSAAAAAEREKATAEEPCERAAAEQEQKKKERDAQKRKKKAEDKKKKKEHEKQEREGM